LIEGHRGCVSQCLLCRLSGAAINALLDRQWQTYFSFCKETAWFSLLCCLPFEVAFLFPVTDLELWAGLAFDFIALFGWANVVSTVLGIISTSLFCDCKNEFEDFSGPWLLADVAFAMFCLLLFWISIKLEFESVCAYSENDKVSTGCCVIGDSLFCFGN